MNLVADFIVGAAADTTLASSAVVVYRPGPDNGSGDSPRPPFLSEFVNQVGEFFFVGLIYHLFGRRSLRGSIRMSKGPSA